ncbi:MAG: hypothetical protein HY553_03340 [Elusimicrobia bacterium]|nr:hypothetical protein [Elusimicrobiota bacterium]
MRDFDRLTRTIEDIFAGIALPKNREVRRALAVARILRGELPDTVASDLRLQKRGAEALVARVRAVGLAGLTAYADRITEQSLAKRRQGIAQMLLGVLAERRFEELSNQITGDGVLRIEDHRPSRTDTDYRLLNGSNNPICRFNIKFHGSLFREARRFVGLDPEDCFALATYKINNALRRQEEEKLPYIFLVLSVPDLSAADVGRLVPGDYVWVLAVLEGRMVIEEAIVARFLRSDNLPRCRPIFDRMPEGQFRVISAKKADRILRERLFERVHALSLKGFTRKFRNAEVDMHFSLFQDLTPVRMFLELLVKESPQKFAVRLYIGDY